MLRYTGHNFKIWALVIRPAVYTTLFCVLYSCRFSHSGNAVPAVYYTADAKQLTRKNGVLYANGQPYNGYLYSLWAEGDTALLEPYQNGKLQGKVCQWYPNGMLKEERFYSQGNKQGKHTGRWPNGNKAFEYNFENDLYNGPVTEWFEHGRIYKKLNYVDGYETGLQQIWYTNGTLHSNYEVRKGRRYGLAGTKHCTTAGKASAMGVR